MKAKIWRKALAWLLLLLTVSCVEPYLPEVMEAPKSYLVVNGFINSKGVTTIQLLRTQNLTDKSLPPAETDAMVLIEGEKGESFRLQETGSVNLEKGTYMSNSLTLNPKEKYRLYIRTKDGKEYASDFVEVKETPAIDNVSWETADNAVQFFVSTHDPENNTRYYRWEFEHTWQVRSAFYTELKYENGKVLPRTSKDERIYDCWKSEKSSSIELGTSAMMSQDVISKYKLFSLSAGSEKLDIKHSVLVKQYAITREAYEYWQILKKNTENIGTLFDPLPSQQPSNIRSLTDPKEPVVGFISASSVQEKRTFVSSKEVPQEWPIYMPSCLLESFMINGDNVRSYFDGGALVPVHELTTPTGQVIGYAYAALSCVDCRTKGRNIKPDYWE